MSPCSALCPLLLAAPPNTLQCLPFAAQMLRAVGLGCGSHSSQAPSKRSGWPVLTNVIAITNFSACNAVQEATGLLFSPGSTEAPLDLGPFDCGNFRGPRGMHRMVFLLQCHPSGLHVFSLSKEKLFKLGIYLPSRTLHLHLTTAIC